ncbi:MAG: GspE/PulE family protein [Candidatus Zixiibacteriota bacterium]
MQALENGGGEHHHRPETMAAKLGQLLVSDGVITESQLEEALKLQRERDQKLKLGQILVKIGAVPDEDIIYEYLGKQLDIAYVKPSDIQLNPEIVKLIPVDIARRYTVIPIFHIGVVLTVAVAEPFDFVAVDEIAYHTKLEVRRVLATRAEIEAAIDKYYSITDTVNISTDRIESEAARLGTDQVFQIVDDIRISSDQPVVDLVNSLVVKAVKDRASDIHFEATERDCTVRYRVDGLMREMATLSAGVHQPVVARIKVMSNMDVSEKRLPQDGRFRMNINDKLIDFRVATLPTTFGEKVAIRILDKGNLLVDLSQMGFSPANYEKWLEIISRPEGLVLITGPTGSGKTTTLYAVLKELNSPEKSIVTVEDPVEYHLARTTQVQINERAGLVFANALRSIVRQNPDIVMVGEIRDHATAEISIRASLTGHLVLSTLHTSDAPVAAGRLIDMGIEPYLVSSSVTAVLAQRLLRVLCHNCKEEVRLDTPLTREFQERNRLPELTFFQGRGCPRCNESGFIGRTAIHELMVVSSELKDLISAKASHIDLRRAALRTGMISLLDDGLMKASKGITTIEEVLRVCHSEDSKISQKDAPSVIKDVSSIQV